jgi:ribosome-binding protein aMBF1 (putative translation factor)
MSDNDNWTTVSSKKALPKNTTPGFEHQNWDNVVINKKPSPNSNQIKKNINPEAIRLAKLDNNDFVKLKSLSIDARQELVKGRVAKGFNQEKLAQALAIPANLYKDIENGKTIPQQNVLSKINSFLGTKVKLT